MRTRLGDTPASSSRDPCTPARERSTSASLVSSRTPHSLGPSARATAIAVAAESFSKSTSTVTFIERW